MNLPEDKGQKFSPNNDHESDGDNCYAAAAAKSLQSYPTLCDP